MTATKSLPLMPRHRITVTEIHTAAEGLTAAQAIENSAVVFAQTFDDLNLRAFVRQLNAMPKRRKKQAATT